MVTQAFQLMDVLKKTPPPLNLENISEIHVDLERGFTLYANGVGVALDLGLKDYSEKLQKFAQLWPVLSAKGIIGQGWAYQPQLSPPGAGHPEGDGSKPIG